MWLARTRDELVANERPASPEQTVLHREVREVIPRRDLSSP
jgi:hypothetical protein